MPVAAQQSGRVYYLTEEYLLWPGLNVASIAERHPEAARPEPVQELDGYYFAGERLPSTLTDLSELAVHLNRIEK